MCRENVLGTVYLLHFSQKVADHAHHYIGWTEGTAEDRLERHKQDGSPLVRAAIAEGATITIAQTWAGTRELERQLKRRHNAPKLCPVCCAIVETA